MKHYVTLGSFIKRTLFVFLILTLIAIPIAWNYASNLTEKEAAEWKMWINLAKNGWAEPMREADPETGKEKVAWYEWHKHIEPKP
jgi:hypothetical protein